MKMIKYIGFLAVCLIAFSCEEFEDDSYDITDPLPQFVELSSGSDLEAAPTDTIAVTIRIRESIYSEVNVGWEVTGGLASSGTAVIPKNKLSASVEFILPASAGEATFEILSADAGYSLGRPNVASSAVTRKIVWE